MAYTPAPITNGIPFVQGTNHYGSMHMSTDAAYIDMNLRILKGAVINPQVSLPNSYGGTAGHLAYDTLRKSLTWFDGNSWIYPALANNTGFNIKRNADLCSGDVDIFQGSAPTGSPANIDGITSFIGDGTYPTSMRVLLTNEATQPKYNGLWYVHTTGPWVRCEDADEADELPGAFVAINALNASKKGTNFEDSIWYCSTNQSEFVTIGTDPNYWTRINFSAYTAGDGINLDGREFNIDIPTSGSTPNSGLGLTVSGSYVNIDTNVASKLDVKLHQTNGVDDGALSKNDGLKVLTDNVTIGINASNKLYTISGVRYTTNTLTGNGTVNTYSLANYGSFSPPVPSVIIGYKLFNDDASGSPDSRFPAGEELMCRWNIDNSGQFLELTFSTENLARYRIVVWGLI